MGNRGSTCSFSGRERGNCQRNLTSRARELRRESSDAEQLLWACLRGRRLAGWKFRRQAIIGRYIVDFLCPTAKLVIEVDGGQHMEQVLYDERRSRVLEAKGYRVLRFWNHEVLVQLDDVLEEIHRVLVRGY